MSMSLRALRTVRELLKAFAESAEDDGLTNAEIMCLILLLDEEFDALIEWADPAPADALSSLKDNLPEMIDELSKAQKKLLTLQEIVSASSSSETTPSVPHSNGPQDTQTGRRNMGSKIA